MCYGQAVLEFSCLLVDQLALIKHAPWMPTGVVLRETRLCNFNLPHAAQCRFAFSPLSVSLWMCILILPIANHNTICLFSFGISLLCLQKYALWIASMSTSQGTRLTQVAS